MSYIIFIACTSCLGIAGALLFSVRNRWQFGRVVVPLLALLLALSGFAEYFASFDNGLVLKTLWIRLAIIFHFGVAAALLELTTTLLGKDKIGTTVKIAFFPVRLCFIWRPLLLLLCIVTFWVPWFSYIRTESELLVVINHVGELIFSLLFCYYLVTLYVIEKIFFYASTMQKRIYMVSLASVGFIALGAMILIVRILFYRIIVFEIVQIHTVISGVFFPGFLLGLMRYRLWQENIVIGRGLVHSSLTILFFGAFLFVLGLIAFGVKLLGVQFSQFNGAVAIFTLIFIGLVLFFSPQMRKNVTAFARKYIYKAKYDYRDQLFRLHQAHQTIGDSTATIRAFIDNLRYTIIVDNVSVFLRTGDKKSYRPMGEERFGEHGELDADSSLVQLLSQGDDEGVTTTAPALTSVAQALAQEKSFLQQYAFSHLFAIRQQDELLGILGFKIGNRLFDSEDRMLVTMFCESIATAIDRDRNQRERIERKQFESFSHMASFILHDIKNQVATLSLLTQNAKDNITNPLFHGTLLRSLENCSVNLSTLVSKLQSPPRKERFVVEEINCSELISDVVETNRLALPAGVSIETALDKTTVVHADRSVLTYTLKNLIINAAESFTHGGSIRCSGGGTSALRVASDHPGITATDFAAYQSYLLIEDNGPGMSREFMEEELFKPFRTTKDKGAGVGLYQCKTLIETMGGRIICLSVERSGTRFYIFL